MLLGCGQIENDTLDPNEVIFTTNDASKLFFKNTRRTYYDLEVNEAAKLEIYRWKEALDENQAQLGLALVNNWRYDEAYLLLEPNEYITLNTLKLKWINEEVGSSGEIIFEPGNKTNHARFAGLVYQQLRAKSQFSIWLENEWQPFFTDNSSKDAFEKTVYDFYRLTERL